MYSCIYVSTVVKHKKVNDISKVKKRRCNNRLRTTYSLRFSFNNSISWGLAVHLKSG